MAKIAELQEIAVSLIRPYEKNAKIHSDEQIAAIMRSIEEFGFLTPCLVERETYNLIAGHGRVEAAKRLGMETVPCVFVEDITEVQRRAYILADNRLSELGEWDDEIVQSELERLLGDGFEIELTGFELDTGEEKIPSKLDIDFNPTQSLPESKLYIYSISAFGVNSEKIVMIKLPQDVVDNFLGAIEKKSVEEIVETLMEGLKNV